MHLWYTRALALSVCALSLMLAGCGGKVIIPAANAMAPTPAVNAAESEGWGTIKGQVVWYANEAPKRAPVNVTKDQEACEKNGKLLEDKLVVNPKNKGVRWCIVYLMDASGFNKDIPVHPKLQEIKNTTVELDQPCCQFEPHVLAIREGQTLLVKNSAGISHNVNLVGGVRGPNINQIVPAGGQFKVEDIKARNLPIMVKCDIHPWMSGRIAVLKNPYFAVTDEDGNFEIKDAPAGNFRLVIWQEEAGWVVSDGKKRSDGKKITIKAGETTDLGKFPLKPAD
jgi:plastocyanin